MAKKSKKVDVVDPVVQVQLAPAAPAVDAYDPIVPLRAVAEKCLPGMKATWWPGIAAFAKLHGVNVDNSKLSQCLNLLHSWGGSRIALKPYM